MRLAQAATQERDPVLLGFKLYAVAWVFDGAVRKWLAPSLSAELYLAKDVLAILLLILAVAITRIARSWVLLLTVLLFLVCAHIASAVPNNLGLPIVAVGVLGYYSHVCIVAALAMRCKLAQAWRFLQKTVIFSAPLQVVIVLAQVQLPPDSFWNRQVDGDATSQFVAGDVVRASGTFSSSSGLTLFIAALAVLCAIASVDAHRRHDGALALAAGSLIILVALGGSRSAIVFATIGAVLILWTALRRGEFGVAVRLVVFGALSWLLVSRFYATTLSAFEERIATASQSEDTTQRLLQTLTSFWGALDSVSLTGDGISTHTFAGMALGSSGPWIENEMSRWVAELGALGLIIIALRLVALLAVTGHLVRAIGRGDGVLAVASALIIFILAFGNISQQSTSQAGFAVLVIAFLAESKRGAAGPPHEAEYDGGLEGSVAGSVGSRHEDLAMVRRSIRGADSDG